MEVKILIQVVEKLRDFEEDSLCKAMEATDTRHWNDAKQVLEDCHITVIKLNHLIASPNESRNVPVGHENWSSLISARHTNFEIGKCD